MTMYIKPRAGETHEKLDVWPIRRSLLNLGRPKLEFGLSHEKFDIWPKPYLPIPSHSNVSTP